MKAKSRVASAVHPNGRTTKREFDPLFQNSPQPMWVFDAETLHFLDVNKAASALYGYSRAEFLAMRLPDLMADGVPATGKKKVRSKKAVGEPHSGRMAHCRKDGSPLLVEVSLHGLEYLDHKAEVAAIREVSGSPDAEKYIGAFLEGARDSMLVIDQYGNIVLVNQRLEKRFGYSRDELIGKSVEMLLPKRFRSVHPSHRADFLANHQKGPVGLGREQWALAKDGSEFPVAIGLNTLQAEEGLLVLTTIRDITEQRQAEQALRQLEDRYRDLVDNSRVLMCTHDLQGNLLSINAWAARALGYASEELIGRNIQDALAPETRPGFQRYLHHIAKNGSADGIMQLITASGERRLWEFHNTLRREDVAEPIVRGTAFDITERRAAERALRDSESLYRELFNNALEGIFRTTPEGQFSSANPALVRMLGYESESEVLLLNVRDLYADPELRVRNLEKLQEAGELRDFEIHLRRRSGETLIALENSRAILDADGRIILYEGTLSDITERKRMEQALRASEAELRALFEAVPDLVLVLDKDGRYLKIVPGHTDMLYAPPEDLLGKTFAEVFSQPKADEFIAHIRKALETRKPVHFEYALLIDSKIKWFSGAAAPLTSDTVVWVARDITRQKEIEGQIQRRLHELEALYDSGLALGQTLDPRQIGRKIIEVLSNRLNWHHAAVRVRRGDTQDVELLAFSEAPGPGSGLEDGHSLASHAITRVGQGMAGWVMQHGRLINCGDLTADPRYHETFPNMLSGLYVPIWAAGRVLGCITVETHQREAFNEDDELLLTTLASQAAAALENARLFGETQQRMSESLALYEFTRDLAAQSDLSTLLRTLAERVASLLNVAGGAVYLHDAERDDLEIVTATDESLPIGTRLQKGSGMAGRVAETREPLVVDDYRMWEGRPAQFVDRSWAAVLEVPMLYRGELIGVLAAYCLHPGQSPRSEHALVGSDGRKFAEEDVRLLSLFAASAAGAIYSARLFDAERLRREEAETLRAEAVHSAERLSTLHAATREIAQISQDPEQVYASIHQAASRLLPTEAFTITLVDGEKNQIQGVYLFDRNGRSPSVNIPFGGSFSSRVILTGETILLKDLAKAELNRVHFGSPEHVRSVLAVPLRVGGQVIGAISAQSYLPDVYKPEDQVSLEMLAAQAAIAIQNAQLYQAALRSAERQSILHRVSQSLTHISQNPEQLYSAIHATADQLMPADVFSIALLDEERNHVEGVYAVDRGKRWPALQFPVGSGYSGWVLKNMETLFLRDARQSNIARRIPFSGDGDTRSVLMVPLRVGEKAIGAMSVQSYRENQYTSEDRAIFEMLGSQVAVAIQNARLFQETSKRAEEFKTLYESAYALPLQRDTTSLLGLVVGRAMELLHASRGSIYLYDPEHKELMPAARRGFEAGLDLPLKLGEGAAGRVAQSREPLIIDDYSTWEGRSPRYEGTPFRAVLEVPMLYGGELIGVLALDEYGENSTRKFTQADARLLSLFAAQAAAALYNARLLEDTRRRLHELESLAKVGEALTGTLDLEPLLENILRTARQAIPAAEKGTILLRGGGEHGHLHVRAQAGYDDPKLGEMPFDDTKGYAGRAFQEKRPILVRDSIPEYEIPFGREIQEVNAVQSAIVAPLIVKDEAIGAIALDNASRTSAFDEADLRLLVLFASSAAVVIENARLFEETRRRAQEFEVLYEATRDISSNQQDLPSLLSALVEKAARLLGSYGSGMYLYDAARGDLEVAVVSKGQAGVGEHVKLGDGAAGHVAQTRTPLVIDDYQAWEGRRSMLDGTPYRALLQVPMIYGGDLIGVLDVFEYDESERTFNEADVKLLTLFASHAAGAVHSARLFEETRKKAAQFASLYETARDLADQRNLTQLLETIVERAGGLLNAPVSGIYLYDKARNDLYVAVNRGFSSSLGVRLAVGEGVAGRVAQSRQAMIIEDHQKWEGRSHQYDAVPLRSVLEVPMLYSGELIGVLTVDEIGDSERKFTQDDADLLSLFASYAASAVHTARLFEQISRRAGEFEALYQTAADLSSQTDVHTLLNTVIQRARDLMNAAGSDVYLLDADARTLELAAANDPDHRRGSRIALGEGVSGRVAESKQPLIINDYRTWEGRSLQYEGLPYTSAIGIPMLYSGQLIGVLTAYNRADRDEGNAGTAFTPQDASLLELLANAAAGAVYVARLLEQTRRRVEQLSALHAVDTAIGSTTDLRVSLQAVLESVIHQLGVDAADVLLLNPSTLTLQYSAGSGFFTSEINRTSSSIGTGRAGKAALERQLVQVPDLTAANSGFLRSNLVAAERFKAYLAVPLIAKGEVKGVLEIFQRAPLDFNEERKSLLDVLAGQAALAIDNARLFEGLEKANLELTMAYDATIEGWSQALELRDQETQGHSNRVLDLTLRLSASMGVPDRQLRDIRRGVLLHDIGKMGIPDAILHKPGPLTPEEWQIMRQHPQYAYDMLAPIIYLRNSLDIPYGHHEKWDGTGYPRGLKAETIPLAARIFAVVDVYDALTSNRPYRGAWSKQRTIEYIVEQSGKHFDPRVVDAFLKLIAD